ncbi:LytR/AlgR family response regulator transcription factor [Wenyingzhuangia aestuarii]|uniref:LytR/AlgR family response regulator transcription factor n=1 Tax=Wenyingzhuangia aestuarii TaxID=1647582 RepID=UPI0014396F3A|nr:LytTR family DNA-binding domain-containing protein [Wenyingzhuangia aestuarii]NJB83117.1 DNA-binding LytR/AlgR family response regulator [Wenyingzhuangia aestuarii]
MNCIIIDDEATARLVIRQLCKQVDSLNIVGEFPDAIEAIKFLNQQEEVDLIFLDIHMPGLTGFDFIQTIKNPPKVVLTTSDPQFAIDAFEYECIVDYIVKPIVLPRFLKAVQKVENLISVDVKEKPIVVQKTEVEKENAPKGNDLYVNIDRRLVKIDIPSIYLIEAKGDYIQIKTDSKSYVVHSTLKKIEDKLPDDLFFKVHRSYIINTTMIVDIEDNSVLIKKDVVPVSRSNKPELIRRLNLL